MTASVFLLVLFAAALHAGWNAIVKGAGDKFAMAVAICLAAALISALLIRYLVRLDGAPDHPLRPLVLQAVMLVAFYAAGVSLASLRG